jgi:hypothetical protein
MGMSPGRWVTISGALNLWVLPRSRLFNLGTLAYPSDSRQSPGTRAIRKTKAELGNEIGLITASPTVELQRRGQRIYNPSYHGENREMDGERNEL